MSKEPPNSKTTSGDFYSLLEVERTASAEEIRRAYYQKARQYHPDKQDSNGNLQQFTELFQELSRAYAVLSDPEKKKRYDISGDPDINFFEDVKGRDWLAYFKELWEGAVCNESIEEYSKQYKESEEEFNDIIKAYENCKGDMNKIINQVPLANVIDDEERITNLILKAIDEKRVKPFKKFIRENAESKTARRKKALKEAKKAEQYLAKLKTQTSAGDLTEEKMAVSHNTKKRMSQLLESLEQRYSEGDSTAFRNKRRKKVVDSLPTEEEFERIQQKLFGTRQGT